MSAPTSRKELPELGEPDANGIYTLPDGTHVRVLRNGTWYNVDDGRFMSGPSREHLVIQTSEDGREMGSRMWSRAREKARQGALIAALKADLAVDDEHDAWGEIVAVRAAVALTNTGRDGTDAARFVGQATGFMNEEEKGGGGGQGKVPIDVNTLMELARAIDSEVDARVAKKRAIDAKVIE